ncbi:MAG TPA: hypothetical protein VGC06_15040 [Actinomycetes bacterium]
MALDKDLVREAEAAREGLLQSQDAAERARPTIITRSAGCTQRVGRCGGSPR